MRVRPARAARARGVDRAAADRGRSAAAAARASSRAGKRVRRGLVTLQARVPVSVTLLCTVCICYLFVNPICTYMYGPALIETR